MRPSTDPQRGRSAGRYVLGELLGRGGMAEVFAGYSIGDHGFQKPVAIKRLLPELANDDVFVERLIGEAKLLVGMQHGNIVSVIDLAREGDDVFLVMEFVDGPSLRQLLKSRGSRGLPLGVATYIVQGAAQGLEFAHARPGGAIIHADISPSNLLLTTSGEVRVADFGIARREGGGHGIVEGKWAYMAPEQARGEPLTPRSDVFALGVVLYELICGAHPFGRQVTAEERDSEPLRVIPPRVVKPSIPHGIDAICMRALAHDPRDRYARMQQLIDALVEERFASGWREGASDLAQAIRECNPHAAAANPRTMITDRPVTIATRSLLKELTPPRRPTPQQVAPEPPSQQYEPPPIQDSGARTNAILAEDVMRAAAMLELPAMLRADGTPMPPFRLADAMAPGQDLASVMGGHTNTDGSQVAAEPIEARGTRWAMGVLALAAVIGVILAFVIAGGKKPSSPDPTPEVAINRPVETIPAKVDETKAKPAEAPAKPVDMAAKPTTNDETPPDDGRDEEGNPKVKAPAKTDDNAPKPDDQKGQTDQKDPKDQKDQKDQGPTNDNGGKTDTPPVEGTKTANPTGSARVVSRPTAAKGEGYLRVSADPWAYATIDGHGRQDTPGKFTLAPGRYTVKFFRSGYTPVARSVVVEAGKTKNVVVSLDKDEEE